MAERYHQKHRSLEAGSRSCKAHPSIPNEGVATYLPLQDDRCCEPDWKFPGMDVPDSLYMLAKCRYIEIYLGFWLSRPPARATQCQAGFWKLPFVSDQGSEAPIH